MTFRDLLYSVPWGLHDLALGLPDWLLDLPWAPAITFFLIAFLVVFWQMPRPQRR